jgi:hypothetical protein
LNDRGFLSYYAFHYVRNAGCSIAYLDLHWACPQH